MQNFTYLSDREEREIESILKKRKKKIAKQQIIFSLIFLFVIVILSMYVIRKTIYTEFDGYMNTEFHNLRAVEDIFVHEVFSSTGDIIEPGDTIFSYTYLSHFTGHENIFYEPEIIHRNREWRIQYDLACQDIEVLRVRIQELKKQIEVEDHNISFGLSDNAKKMKLKADLAEAEEELKARQRKLLVMLNAAKETDNLIKRTGAASASLFFNDVRNRKLMEDLGLIRYSTSIHNAVVTKVWVPNDISVLKGEPIVQTQGLDLKQNNLSITALVPIHKMDKINRNSKVEVIVNDDISFRAHVNLLGTRTEEIPEHLRGVLEDEHMAVAADLTIDTGQTIPFWVLVKNVPITIRINNLKKVVSEGTDYLYYNTTNGNLVDIDTLEYKN